MSNKNFVDLLRDSQKQSDQYMESASNKMKKEESYSRIALIVSIISAVFSAIAAIASLIALFR